MTLLLYLHHRKTKVFLEHCTFKMSPSQSILMQKNYDFLVFLVYTSLYDCSIIIVPVSVKPYSLGDIEDSLNSWSVILIPTCIKDIYNAIIM